MCDHEAVDGIVGDEWEASWLARFRSTLTDAHPGWDAATITAVAEVWRKIEVMRRTRGEAK